MINIILVKLREYQGIIFCLPPSPPAPAISQVHVYLRPLQQSLEGGQAAGQVEGCTPFPGEVGGGAGGAGTVPGDYISHSGIPPQHLPHGPCVPPHSSDVQGVVPPAIGGQEAVWALQEEGEAGVVPLHQGQVQGTVPGTVLQGSVSPHLEQSLHQVGLPVDHGQVEGCALRQVGSIDLGPSVCEGQDGLLLVTEDSVVKGGVTLLGRMLQE